MNWYWILFKSIDVVVMGKIRTLLDLHWFYHAVCASMCKCIIQLILNYRLHKLCDFKSSGISKFCLWTKCILLSLNFKVSTNNMSPIQLSSFISHHCLPRAFRWSQRLYSFALLEFSSLTSCCVLTPLWLKHLPINILFLISPHPFKPNPTVGPAVKSQSSQANS